MSDGKRIKEVDQEEYKYLGVLQLDKTTNKEMKENIENEYVKRVKLICKSNLNAENFISGLNVWAIGVMWYNGRIIDWTKEEFQDMDRKTRKINDIEQIFAPRK